MKYARELLKGNTDALLLSLIAEEPKYGYSLSKEIEARSNGYFRFKEGTLYPALHRMEKAGLVAGKWQRSPNGQLRRYYHITEKGKRFLEKKTIEWRDFSLAINLVLKPGST
ncbi:MAG: helix-turn-helix transcriptional regulator [Chloroflexi bacterium]|nr:helix-turn-helix transcriptional regulator [Chloroflexota bacterium]